MAHFAELNSSNEVINVIVVNDSDVTANGGDQSTTAETWVENNIPHSTGGTAWKQTSFTGSFRKQYAIIGSSYYDATKDMFIRNKPYDSWTLDSNGDWQPPSTYPADDDGSTTFDNNGTSVTLSQVFWDEDNTRWVGHTSDSSATTYDKWVYNSSTSTWTFDSTISMS